MTVEQWVDSVENLFTILSADIVDAVPDRDSLLLQEAVQLLQTVEDDETRVPLQQGGTKHWVVHNQRLLNVRDM